jgi:hypothetical protein
MRWFYRLRVCLLRPFVSLKNIFQRISS